MEEKIKELEQTIEKLKLENQLLKQDPQERKEKMFNNLVKDFEKLNSDNLFSYKIENNSFIIDSVDYDCDINLNDNNYMIVDHTIKDSFSAVKHAMDDILFRYNVEMISAYDENMQYPYLANTSFEHLTCICLENDEVKIKIYPNSNVYVFQNNKNQIQIKSQFFFLVL